MSLLGSNGEYQDLLGQNASSMSIDVDELTVQDSVKLDYADPNKNLITDANKNVITIDQDSFSNTDGNVVITQTDRNFDINLNTFSANKNIVSGASGELTTENKDSFVNVANRITWTEGAGRVFTADLPQDIATNSNVTFNTVKTNEILGNFSKIVYQDTIDGLSKFFYPEITGTTSAFSLGRIDRKWTSVHTNNLNSTIRVGDTYITPYISNIGSLGDASYIWDSAHINNINTNNINAIGSTINFNDDVSATNITATDITSTDITATDLKVDNLFNALDDFKIYQSGSNPTTTQTEFENSSVSGGTISTTTNTDDTFTSNNSINRSGAIGATDLILSSNPLTSFTATNEFEITQWNNNTLFLGFIKNTYSPATTIFGTNPKVFLQIGSGNDLLAYYNSSGTPNITSLSTSSTIGTVGYKYTFDIDNNKNLTIDKYTPGTTTYVSFTTGNYTTTGSGGRGRYATCFSLGNNEYRIQTYYNAGYNNIADRWGWRSDTSFRLDQVQGIEAEFTLVENTGSGSGDGKILYMGFVEANSDLSQASFSVNIDDLNINSAFVDYYAPNNSYNVWRRDNVITTHTSTPLNIPVSGAYVPYPVDSSTNSSYIGSKHKIRIDSNGNIEIDFFDARTSTWYNNIGSVSPIDIRTDLSYQVAVWDNNTTASSKASIDVKCSITTPATTQQIFNSATIPTPFTLDNDSYRLFVSDNTTSQTQYEVVIDGSINDPGTLITKTELNYLTADKNLILDTNNLLQVEDKDTITGTTNQINVNQVGRAFTLSAPQDLHTSANFQVATLNTGQGANELYAMDQDVKTTDDVTFNTINTGQGANSLYAMDQDVKTTDDVKFNSIQLSMGSQSNPAIFSETEGIFFNDSPKRINFCLDNTESIRITTDAIRSVVDNTYDLGFNGVDFKTLYIKNIQNQTKLVLNQLNAWDVVYLDANKEVKGINLPSEHLLVGNANAPPSTRLIGEAYELHQNQVGTKFDPVKTSSTITILANGLGIHMDNSGVHRAMCINGITIPNTDYTGVETRFGFELLQYANNPNLCFGFCIDSLPVDTDVIAGVTGNYSINMHNGKVHEDGVDKGNIAGFSYAIGDIFEFRIKTNDQFVIYQNGQEIYGSTGSITSGTYYPQVFDSNSNTTEFRVLLRPSYRGGQIDTIRVNTDYLTVNSFSYVECISWSTNLSGRALTLTGNGTPDQIDFILTTSGNDFTQSANGALRYDGEERKSFNVTYQVSCKPEATAIFTNPRLFSTHIDKNATTLTQSRCVQAFYYQSGNQVSTALFSSSVVVDLSKNNTISLYLTNHSDTGDAVVPSVKISIMEIPK